MDVAALMDLAASTPDTAAEHLAKIYEWKHSQISSTGKAFAGGGLALFLAPLVPVLAPEVGATLTWFGVVITWTAAGLLFVVGSIVFFEARKLEAEYLAAQSLLGQIVEIHPFLRLYKGRVQ